MRFWKGGGGVVASSPEPRSVNRLGTWLRILSFLTRADCSEVGLKQSLERRGKSLHRGWNYLHLAGRRESNGEGLVQSRDHGEARSALPHPGAVAGAFWATWSRCSRVGSGVSLLWPPVL